MEADKDKLLAELLAENARLRGELAAALARIAELERAAARQAAPFRRDEAKKVPPAEKKRPGQKPGHRGAYRQRPEHIDEEIEVPLQRCPDCGGPLRDCFPLVQYIEEIPALRPHVTRLTTWQGQCPACQKQVASSHPLKTSLAQGAAAVHLGPRALAIAALLNKHLGLTMGKTCRVLRKLLGLSITRGGLSQAVDRVADKLQGQYDALVEQIRASPAVFADETSWWVGEPGWWLWAFTTDQATLYRVDHSRAAAVVRQTLGDDFAGMLVSDCLASYDPIDCRKHKCIAHHLRAISQAQQRADTPDKAYLDECRIAIKTIGILYKLRPLLSAEEFAFRRGALENHLTQLLARPVTQAGDVAVQNRLLKQHAHLTGCLHEPAAEPTNNRAERVLRPAVIARKLSCGNRTPRGKRTWEVVVSVAETCRQNTIDFIDHLTQLLPLAPQAG
jgi:transposase